MLDDYIYCPVCGKDITFKNNYCYFCKAQQDNPIIPQKTLKEYQKEAEKRFPKDECNIYGSRGALRWREIILIDEIATNPLFNKEACLRRLKREALRYKEEIKKREQEAPQDDSKSIEWAYPQYKKTQKASNIPKCPICGSTNLKKLSIIKRGLHAYAFGIFSKTAFSQFECMSCHYKF